MARPYTFRSRFLLTAGIVSLFTLATSQPAHATPARSFAGLSYFQKRSKDADELALDASRKTPLLDEIPGYAAGVAQQISLDPQHPVYFKVKSDIYPFTIKSTAGDSIAAQIASGMDTKIIAGHTESYDADHDAHNDIAITLDAVSSDIAQLTILKLPQDAPQVNAASTTPFAYLKWGLIAVLFIAATATIIVRSRRQARRAKR